jgi:hypothetical protein
VSRLGFVAYSRTPCDLHADNLLRLHIVLSVNQVHDMKARDVMNRRVTAATPHVIGRDLALQLLSGP